MAFWKWGKKADSDSQNSVDDLVSKAWSEASAAMLFYLDYRDKYNLPFTPERWRDDFALGFRDGICQIHFSIFNKISNFDVALHWRQKVIFNDDYLEEIWLKVIADNGGYTERGTSGFQAARILETWRLKKENVEGGLDYISQFEKEYRDEHPDASQFNVDHWLIMSHFVIPLISADKVIHPYLVDYHRFTPGS